MAKSKDAPEIYEAPEVNLDKPGFHLLKSGKTLTIAGKSFRRFKDVVIGKYVEKSIQKISYVPNSIIKAHNINLKHFESETFETIPAIKRENNKQVREKVTKWR
jgi:hypothetical protein